MISFRIRALTRLPARKLAGLKAKPTFLKIKSGKTISYLDINIAGKDIYEPITGKGLKVAVTKLQDSVRP